MPKVFVCRVICDKVLFGVTFMWFEFEYIFIYNNKVPFGYYPLRDNPLR